MSSIHVRPFRRSDRDQLTALVNAHVRAVVPGLSVSVNTVLSRLEREPDEVIVDPWVVERSTLVAEQDGAVAAAAHVLRYGTGPEVGESYRGTGELRWMIGRSFADDGSDATAASDAVTVAAVHALVRAGARRIVAGGALPAPGVYGVPEVWPHVDAVLRRAGFTPGDRTEIVLLAEVDALARTRPPLAGLTVRRSVGSIGVRLAAVRDGETLGYVEVEEQVGDLGRQARTTGVADIGNLGVREDHRRRGIATWLLGQAADWLRLGHVDRLLDYATPDEEGYLAFLRHAGFTELTRTTTWYEHRRARS